VCCAKRIANILSPGSGEESGLGRRVPTTGQRIRRKGEVECSRDPIRDGIDVIEAAMALAPWV